MFLLFSGRDDFFGDVFGVNFLLFASVQSVPKAKGEQEGYGCEHGSGRKAAAKKRCPAFAALQHIIQKVLRYRGLVVF